MDIAIKEDGKTVIVELLHELAGTPTGEVDRILELLGPGRELRLEFSQVKRLSSIGLRNLLLFCRHVQALGIPVQFTGVPPKLLDAAEAAGFLHMFQGLPTAPAVTLPVSHALRIDTYPTHRHGKFALRQGFPNPLGTSPVIRGINFAIFSHHATDCTLVLYHVGDRKPHAEIPFPDEFRIGDVFAMIVFDLDIEDLEYGFRMGGPFEPKHGHRFDRSRVLLDPTARSVAGRNQWGAEQPGLANGNPFRSRIVPGDFDWEGDRPLGLPFEDLIIYEMHVRGFTKSPTSKTKYPGTYSALREKIGHLKKLGVNCVELMPVFEFDELENPRKHPYSGEPLYNYWGYNTIAFYAPKAGYAATGVMGMQSDEFKALVKELHENGIEVILDVVFNHTGEGNEFGPTISFRGLDNRIYYMLTPYGHYQNFTGCGNTFNCNHPVVRSFVLLCLRHWVAEYHIDGFRFDLASVLGRDVDGRPLANPPLLESLAMDPVLSRTKLIAEAWDAGGLYQVGTFPDYDRWAEWNGKYRDAIRQFLKGDLGQVPEVAQRLVGSPDLYESRGPTASINFVTCHDGFTLADLVSYNHKHNTANGEHSRDGADHNASWNCGVEGPTDDPEINALRLKQMKNALAILLLSRGIPMMLMGDECGRTQYGNNNAYCHDSPLTWFDWTLPKKNSEIFRFCKKMIQFRQYHAVLRSRSHEPVTHGQGEDGSDIVWHGTRCRDPDWSSSSRIVAYQLCGSNRDDSLYIAMNMYWESIAFELPVTHRDQYWRMAIDTSVKTTKGTYSPGATLPLEDQQFVEVAGRSVIVLVSR